MKVKELIEHLKQFDENLEVYAMTDHGQSPETVRTPELIYASSGSYTLWDEWTEDVDAAADLDFQVKVVLL